MRSEVSRETQWLYRVGGVSAIAGAIIGLIGNLIHPVTAGPSDPEETARVVADSHLWVPLHPALLVAFLLMLGGLVAIGASITGGLAGALARFGFAAAIVGTTAGVIDVTLDGFAAKHLAEWWVSAPPGARATAIVPFRSEDAVNFALLSPLNLVFAGFTFVLYGLAAALSGRYPRWLGWTVAAGGVGGAISGGIQASMGEPIGITRVLGIAAPTIITMWLLIMGVLLLRSGWEPVDPNATVARGAAPDGGPASAGADPPTAATSSQSNRCGAPRAWTGSAAGLGKVDGGQGGGGLRELTDPGWILRSTC